MIAQGLIIVEKDCQLNCDLCTDRACPVSNLKK